MSVLLVLGACGLAADAAAAGPPRLKSSTGAALPDAPVRVVGHGFPRRRAVRLLLAGELVKRARTGRRGGFRTSFLVPARPAGVYRLVARARGKRARLRFEVLARPAPSSTPSPPPPDPPPPPERTTLVAAGDVACRPGLSVLPERCHQAATAQRVLALGPDAVAVLGDAQYETGELADYLASYDPSWGAFKSISHPVAGNHEYQEDDPLDRDTAEGHFGYFGALAGDPDKGYYRYEVGSWTVFALNSGALEWTRAGRPGEALPDDCYPVSCAAGSEQEQWLRGELEELPDDACVIATWHHPLVSSGWDNGTKDHPELSAIYQALYEHGADLALTGHTHSYERFAPFDASGAADPVGVRQFVVGTGGRNLFDDPADVPPPTSERLITTSFGVLELELSEGEYSFRFVAEDGTVLDSGGAGCHDRPDEP